ncbi:MAG: hypothetical protein IIA92_02910 [Chloroflexi bacterium]|nr:hypothetical protein [Chloroflexota bacterium]
MKVAAERTKRNNLNRAVAEHAAQRAAPASLPLTLDDNSAQAEAQRRLRKMADNSPQTKKAAQLQAMIDNSPRIAAQRQQLERIFGKPVQRQEPLEEEKLLQGKFVPDQKNKKSAEEKLQMEAAVPGQALPTTSYAMFGLKSGVGEDEFLLGRTVGEFIGDVARPVGTFVGNVVGAVAGALTGISISSATHAGPTWNNHGAFIWGVGFNTTGRGGWIVQDIATTWRGENALGNAIPNPITPHYWEAWAVDGVGNITPNNGAVNDYWNLPNSQAALGAAEGHWSAKGKLYFSTTDPATQGFTRNNPATNAGLLLSSTTAPAGLGIARLHRYAQGTWDSTTALLPTHSGSAGP